MRFWTHDGYAFPLPDGHKFPISKYPRLKERLLAEGIARPGDIRASEPADWALLGEVHQQAYLGRVRDGTLSDLEIRRLGLPWSAELVERGRRSTQGTIEAARDAMRGGWGMNLGGGTHHAGRAAGRGFCLFNDIAVAIAALRAERTIVPGAVGPVAAGAEGLSDGRDAPAAEPAPLGPVAVIDCDVHQGDGTAELLQPDPMVFTLSLHGGANYPFKRATSDLDIDLPTGTGDDAYLEALRGALDAVEAWAVPQLVFFLAGADPWEGDRLGRLALTKAGLAARDALVFDRAEAWGAAACVVLAGGYAPNVDDTVDINAATAGAVADRAG